MIQAPATLPGPNLVAGRYDVGEVLASGGVGTVHTGFDRLAQRPVAYKRLLPASDAARPRLTALFRREYNTLTHLTHPNIVEVYDYGFDSTGPYYTMELLSGSDLTKLAPLPVRDACRVLRDVASALALIHARRFVHRDVSPNNVRLTADGRAKLIDFGGLSAFGVPSEIVGTPAFTAPESLAGAALDQRTDLYALGALAYWTLTRRTHVRARSLDELSYAWEDEIVPPSHHVPELPKALDDLVMSLLQYDPVARPAHAADVIERLTAVAELAVEDDEQRVAFSYLQHAPQLGREPIMELLDQGLRAAIEGAGQMVLLEAEQGLGRSSVLHELAVSAQLTGATVLRVDSGLYTTPFAAARHLVDTGFRIFPDLRQRARERSSRPARFVDRDGKAPRSALDAAQHQSMLATLLKDDLLQLSQRTPLVVLIDDAHTVDAESLALFASMADALSTAAILMVLSVQSGQVAHNPDAQIKIESCAQRCRLTPLSEQHLLQLVTTMFGAVQNSQHLATWLHEQAGGNPGHCIDLARLLLARGAIRYAVGTFTLPREFDQGVAIARHGEAALATIAGLPAQTRDVAYLAGIHTGALTNEQLGIAAGLSTRDVVLTCEQLVQRGVLVVSPDSVSCASESLRAALMSSRDEAARRTAHLALARALAATMHSVDDRVSCARHLLAAGGEHAFEGASLLARVEDRSKLDLACSRPTLPLLERALALLDARGVPDEECLGLLIPLSLAGFYGQLDVQYRYLSRTMNALSLLLGVTLAQRLSRYLGGGLALIVGMLVGWVRFMCTKRSLNQRTFLQLFTNYGAIPSSASAASACAWDVPETYRIAHMLDPFAAAAKRSPMYLMRKFCLATADLLSVKMQAASDSYAELYRIFQGKIMGFDELSLEQFRCGCLHGQAQALVTDAAPEAMALADQLEQRHAFFAPHAAGIRMTYHLYRGEWHKAL
ncbi:MAG TPA: serine/threonine-protein kinase, partial [Polyangiales bacterium]